MAEYPIPNARVMDLRPGDVVGPGTFIAAAEHPVYVTDNRGYSGRMALVIWRMDDGRWSYDALNFEQVVGTAIRDTDDQAVRRRVP